MTARRGSLRYKVTRLARASHAPGAQAPAWRARLARWAFVGSRIVAGCAALLVIGACGVQTFRIAAENYRLHRLVDAVERRDEDLSSETSRLQREVVLLHDPAYLVPLIHEQLGLVKPHEVFIVVSPTPAPQSGQ